MAADKVVDGSSCSVTVTTSASKKPCILGTNYGCDSHGAMWIAPGCRGQFFCEGYNVTCGYQGNTITGTPPRRYCPCAPMHRHALFDAPGAQPVFDPPSELFAPPRLLKKVNAGNPRFVPASFDEVITATFALWNLLDQIMYHEAPNYAYQGGYIRELQLRRMVQLARALPAGSTYCEIGMNGGHSSAAMLYANPKLTVHAFDLFAFNYSTPVARLLRTHFGSRFHAHEGDSTVTVPAWAKERPNACDLAFVDGDHSKEGAMRDMLNTRFATVDGAEVVADDINSAPGTALAKLQELGQVRVVEAYGPFDAPHEFSPCMSRVFGRNAVCGSWGFAVFRYMPNPPSVPELDELRFARTQGAAIQAGYRVDRAKLRTSSANLAAHMAAQDAAWRAARNSTASQSAHAARAHTTKMDNRAKAKGAH